MCWNANVTHPLKHLLEEVNVMVSTYVKKQRERGIEVLFFLLAFFCNWYKVAKRHFFVNFFFFGTSKYLQNGCQKWSLLLRLVHFVLFCLCCVLYSCMLWLNITLTCTSVCLWSQWNKPLILPCTVFPTPHPPPPYPLPLISLFPPLSHLSPSTKGDPELTSKCFPHTLTATLVLLCSIMVYLSSIRSEAPWTICRWGGMGGVLRQMKI